MNRPLDLNSLIEQVESSAVPGQSREAQPTQGGGTVEMSPEVRHVMSMPGIEACNYLESLFQKLEAVRHDANVVLSMTSLLELDPRFNKLTPKTLLALAKIGISSVKDLGEKVLDEHIETFPGRDNEILIDILEHPQSQTKPDKRKRLR